MLVFFLGEVVVKIDGGFSGGKRFDSGLNEREIFYEDDPAT
jgi:hypothetical protein